MPDNLQKISKFLFRNRSYTPVPWLILMLWFADPNPPGILLGLLLVCLGEGLRAWGVSYAGVETRTTGDVGASRLVTSGPFAFVRNPLYLGNIIIYTGLGVMSWAWWPWLPLAAVIWFLVQYYLIVKEEERFLEQTFGEEYRQYRKRVPAFFPRLSPYVSPHQQTNDWRGAFRSEARTLQAIGAVSLIIVVMYFVR
ncbi:MAG: isoprenylcysteine carboxylmethyltransferase family protein [Chlorobi bacterium]|nr:isoprenylcysteine carboxylmethyltransferase family protein [Chlorobiota bacterium]